MLATCSRAMRVAVEGCTHGCLDQIYSSIRALDRRDKRQTDLLILCGDVQTVRNVADMDCLAVPNKYKQLGDFHRYYSGKRRAPILTVMIGGNHEASNYLYELYYGGWVAPNIYYLGTAGCIEVGGLTITGISGIYKSHDFTLGRHERMPYSGSAVRSVYHTRCYDTYRLHMLKRTPQCTSPTVAISHDWPNTIEQHGDVHWLKRKKPFFKAEIDAQSLGSPPLMDLLRDLKPAYWFSAHLHVRFAAKFKHDGQQTRLRGSQRAEKQFEEVQADVDDGVLRAVDRISEGDEHLALTRTDARNPDEIAIDEDEFDEPVDLKHLPQIDSKDVQLASSETVAGAPAKANRETRFLALSKCLAGHDYMQVLDIPAPVDRDSSFRTVARETPGEAQQPSLRFSPHWLAVLRATQPLLSLQRTQASLPKLDDAAMGEALKREYDWVQANLLDAVDHNCDSHPLDVRRTQTFVPTAPNTSNPKLGSARGPPAWYTNPQTESLCRFIDMPNLINPPPPVPMPSSSQESSGLAPAHLIFNGPPVGPRPPQLPQAPILPEEDEIRRIEAAAQAAMLRKKSVTTNSHRGTSSTPVLAASEEEILVTLSDDDEDEQAARWKEGTG